MAKDALLKTCHLAMLVHHMYATVYYHFLVDYSKTNDDTVHLIKKFNVCYLTTWNFVLQMFFLSMSVAVDYMPKTHKKLAALEKYKGYLFHSIIVPATFAVSTMFWTVYHINRELIYPSACDEVIPKWLNHSSHTIIVFVVLIEYLLGKNVTPSFKSALFGLTCLTIAYQSIYMLTFFSIGKWLYNIYYILSWTERLLLKAGLYGASVLIMKGNLSFHSYKNAGKELKLM